MCNRPGAGTGVSSQPITAPINVDQCKAVGGIDSGDGQTKSEDYEATCFYSDDDKEKPAATIERVLELAEDESLVHIRLIFDPEFVDNTYGEESVGWEDSKKGGHKFKDLVGSDHAEFKITNSGGEVVLHFKVDYISEDPTRSSGYGSLGVSDKNGEMIHGDASSILAVMTSLDRNFNACGFSEYTEDSPSTDSDYAANPDTPEWDYRVVYEVWLDADVFGNSGIGEVFIEYVHASPSKTGNNTVEVEEGPCDPDDDPGDTDDDPGDPTDAGTPPSEDAGKSLEPH